MENHFNKSANGLLLTVPVAGSCGMLADDDFFDDVFNGFSEEKTRFLIICNFCF